MPRKRPGRLRAEIAVRERCLNGRLEPITGLSRRTLYEIVRLEETRNYLWAGAVGESLARWRSFVRTDNRRLWDPGQEGCTEWLCCGDPLRARQNLEGAMLALPRRCGRELRLIVLELDEWY